MSGNFLCRKRLSLFAVSYSLYNHCWEKERNMKEPQECRVVIGLADITGFAKACENKPDIETFEMLNKF